MKRLWSTLVLAILFLGTSSCSKGSDTKPANVAYPAPATQTNLSATPEIDLTQEFIDLILTPSTQRPDFTPPPSRTPRPTLTALPTRWRDFTPTPNLTSGVWAEFSSQITYLNRSSGATMGPLHFKVRYPSDWYLYPSYTLIFDGEEIHGPQIQNYKERITQENLFLEAGRVHLTISAGPCNTIEHGCLVGLPLLSLGLPGTQEVKYQSYLNHTYWETILYVKDMFFSLGGNMIGTPEENADLIKILDKILATVVIDYKGTPPPTQTPTP